MTLEHSAIEHHDPGSLASPVPWQPEDHDVFRLAQLTLLLSVAAKLDKQVSTVDRLGYYDFFSANPFVVVGGSSRQDQRDRLALTLAGFVQRQLSYASTGQRWISRRRRLQHDLSILVSLGIVSMRGSAFVLTGAGLDLANGLTSVYADSFRASAEIVVRRLSRLSDKALVEASQDWIGSTWLSVDLLADVTADSVRIEGADT